MASTGAVAKEGLFLLESSAVRHGGSMEGWRRERERGRGREGKRGEKESVGRRFKGAPPLVDAAPFLCVSIEAAASKA